ncbi:MAG TPA: hypothetical protein DCS66_21605 [Flavobacteriaceae bacterium]|jgi:hypothetical protein|nr:hypothetical protein [Flavobacteriaceae bacterium]HAT67156.1 hypothetical protein [Flavobacteriaceae bacterium]|tara:strand:- start:16489 stop:16965 length:477 start_codon:yes stop_codon:yes gene_type:complete
MELAKITKLLDAYFEGNTTLAEEAQLRDFFSSGSVPEHLQGYTALFASFQEAKKETFEKEIKLPSERKQNNFWKWSIAASVALLVGISSYMYFNNNGLSAEEEEALMAFNQAKETMFLLSENLNKGTQKVTFINEFSENTATINLINQFTESKNLILK